MKLKKVIIITAVSVLCIAGITTAAVYNVKNSQKSVVTVVKMQELNNGYMGNSTYMGGLVTSDVSQNVFLTDQQSVEEIFVKEGDQVKEGDPLISYDMTTVNMTLEQEKLNKEGIELKIQVAERDLKKLKNTKPSSGGGGGSFFPGGGGGIPVIPEPTETPTPEPTDTPVPTETPTPTPPEEIKPYEILNFESEPFDGEGTEEKPYRFLCQDQTVVTGGFMNKMAGFKDEEGSERESEGYYFCLEIHAENKVEGEVLRMWQQDGRELEVFEKEWETVLKMDEVTPTPTDTPMPTDTPFPTGDPTPTAEPTDVPEPTETPTPTEIPQMEVQYMEDMAFNSDLVYYGQKPNVMRTVAYSPQEDLVFVSADMIDQWKKQIQEKEREIKNLKLDLKQSDLKIRQISKQLEDKVVTATIKGVVKKVGDPTKPDPSAGPFIQVVSSEGLYVKSSVSELMLDMIKPGTKLMVNSWESGNTYEAEVKEVSIYPEEQNMFGGGSNQNVSYYPLIAYVENAEGLNNMEYVDLNLAGANQNMNNNTISISQAFIREEGGKKYVFKDDKGKLKKQEVTTGKTFWDSCEILSGITMEDKLAFPYGKYVKEGARTKDGTYQDLYNTK